MMNDEGFKVRWTVKNPFGHEVILKEDTYEKHVVADHTTEDAQQRINAEASVKDTVERPRFIVADKEHGTRYKYLDLVTIPYTDSVKIRALAVIIDVSTNPHEVVTWIPQNKIKEAVETEGLVYDAKKGIISNS